jgi:uncharacterized protein
VRLLDVRDLLGHPGAVREERLRESLEGLETELAGVPAPIDADLVLEALVEGICVTGTVRGTLALRCARCLAAFERGFEIRVHELFVRDAADDGEEYPFDPERGIDPEQMLRDAIGTELPFSPLCRPDCLGLCEVCGGDRNLRECPGHERVDPRLAALADLLPLLADPDGGADRG